MRFLLVPIRHLLLNRFTVSGSGLSNPLTVTAPAGFEVSLNAGSGFSNSLSLSLASGNVSTTTIYVRLTSQSAGNPSGNIVCASSPAVPVNIAVMVQSNLYRY